MLIGLKNTRKQKTNKKKKKTTTKKQQQGNTQHESPRCENHKAIQNKSNTRTTALERSVA